MHRHEVGLPLPQGSSLLPELCCLEPLSLNRPHPPHSWAHRDFTARRLIRDVFAVRERLSDPRVVPSFRCTSFLHPPLHPEFDIYLLLRLRPGNTGSTLPIPPQSVSRGRSFRGCTGSQLLRPVRLLASPDGSDRSPGQRGLLLPGFQRVVILPAAGYDYNSDWTPLLAGLSPAGMAASLAALIQPCSRP